MALKILNMNGTKQSDPLQSNEVLMLRRSCEGKEPEHRPQKPSYGDLNRKSAPHPGWFRVTPIFTAFIYDDLKLKHLVIVMPLFGETMREYVLSEPSERLAPAFIKQVARDTLEALDYLHNHCGIIHTGM